jgi:hypothetical protein
LGIRIQEGQIGPPKEKIRKISTFEESALKRFKAIYMTVYQKIVHLNFFGNFVIINHGLGPDPDRIVFSNRLGPDLVNMDPKH